MLLNNARIMGEMERRATLARGTRYAKTAAIGIGEQAEEEALGV